MKKISMLLLVVFLMGCNANKGSATKIDENTKVPSAKIRANTKEEEIINLLKADGVTDFKLIKKSVTSLILQNSICKITVTLDNKKTKEIVSAPLKKLNEEDNCIFRTLVKDSDLIGDNKELQKKYLAQFSESTNFKIGQVLVRRSEDGITFLKK